MSKHTPGPWKFYDDSNDGKTNRIEIVAIGKTVARIYHSVPEEDLPIAALRAALAEQPVPVDLDAMGIPHDQLFQPAEQELVAWGLPRPDGTIIDCITPEEHAREPGQYTVPLCKCQLKAEPLTRDQVKTLLVEAGYDGAAAQHRADFINGLRHGELAHGITGETK